MKLAIAFLLFAAPTSGATCESLSTFSQPHVSVTLAQAVAAGQFTPPNPRGGRAGANPFAALPAFCRVAATRQKDGRLAKAFAPRAPRPGAVNAPGATVCASVTATCACETVDRLSHVAPSAGEANRRQVAASLTMVIWQA